MSGRGKAQKTLALVEAARLILEEIQPASVRAICYRLFVAGLIPSMEKTHTNAVSTHLVWAREQEIIPWEWIVDETREPERVASWDKPEEIIAAAVRQYRKNYWTDQEAWAEVWSEKGTVRGTLAPVLNKYGVTFRVMHGYGSATALHDIAEETAALACEKSLLVLYVGDWDPSGMHMSEIDLPDRLQRYGGSAQFVRVALNDEDVEDGTDIPSFKVESKVKDPRHDWFVGQYGHRCWELDALSPVILRQRIESEIVSVLDMDAWNHAVDVEIAEKDSMQTILTTWKSISGQASKYSGDRQ